MNYQKFLSEKKQFWKKTKQIEFINLEKIELFLKTKFETLTIRNSMNLRMLGLVDKEKNGKVKLTSGAKVFLESNKEEKQKIINFALEKIYLDDATINNKLKLPVYPFACFLKIVREFGNITFDEYKMFIVWIHSENEIDCVIDMIKEFRSSEKKERFNKIFNLKIKNLKIKDFDDHVGRLFKMFSLSNLLTYTDSFEKQYKLANSVDLFKKTEFDINNVCPITIKFDINNVSPTKLEIKLEKILPKKKKIQKNRKVKIDYNKKNILSLKHGENAEEIVQKFEKNELIKNGRKDLSLKIEIVSKFNDSLGYDILSFDKDGNKKLIEVKSVSEDLNKNISFLISANELEMHKNNKNHIIYFVSSSQSANPKISILPKLVIENKNVLITPTNYQIAINITKTKTQ